jgi:hypothetical protein
VICSSLTALEEDQVRDAPDAVALGGARVVVDVHLHDLELAGVLLRQLVDDRGDGRQGAHQGAQKSISTGVPLCRTSVSNVSSEIA